jgi:hypothetical protein
VHSKDSIQDGFVMHMETGRIFLNVSLYRHVLECGFFGCTAFVGRNSSLEDAQVGEYSIVGCPTFLILPLVFYRILDPHPFNVDSDPTTKTRKRIQIW